MPSIQLKFVQLNYGSSQIISIHLFFINSQVSWCLLYLFRIHTLSSNTIYVLCIKSCRMSSLFPTIFISSTFSCSSSAQFEPRNPQRISSTQFIIIRIYTAKHHLSIPKFQRCLPCAISSYEFLILMKSVTSVFWYMYINLFGRLVSLSPHTSKQKYFFLNIYLILMNNAFIIPR